MERAKLILGVVGICAVAAGGMDLSCPQTNPEALSQSFFVWVAMTGALNRQGVILILVGLGCFVLAALLPADRE